ncbi:MAG: hypothetical protein LBU87_00360 [Lactobacillales bacterium]|jgi:hypothetical protein|nr:hypothetical protein [Lactobacillales bacterium]
MTYEDNLPDLSIHSDEIDVISHLSVLSASPNSDVKMKLFITTLPVFLLYKITQSDLVTDSGKEFISSCLSEKQKTDLKNYQPLEYENNVDLDTPETLLSDEDIPQAPVNKAVALIADRDIPEPIKQMALSALEREKPRSERRTVRETAFRKRKDALDNPDGIGRPDPAIERKALHVEMRGILQIFNKNLSYG